MTNPVLERIKKFAIEELNKSYGYCGVAESGTNVMINSDDGEGHDIIITIKETDE